MPNPIHIFVLKHILTILRLSSYFVMGAICLLIINPSVAQSAKIKGRIINKETNASVPTAFVELYDGLVPLQEFPLAVSVDGYFAVTLPKELNHVTIKFTAPNYLRLTQTVLLPNEKDVELGNVQLSPLPSLKLSSIVSNYSSNNRKNLFDLAISNSSKENVFIKKILITGQRKSKTECFDISKVITIEINERSEGSNAIIRTSGQIPADRIAIKGKMEALPCEQMRLQYEIKYGILIGPSENFMVRVILPSEISYLKRKRKVDLDRWDILAIRFFLENGEIIETKI